MQQTSPTTTTRYDWESMLTESDYATMLFIQELMHKGEYQAAKEGIDQLVDFETQTEKMNMERALVKLMEAIILWKECEEHRTSEQVAEINQARDNVDFYIEEGTELNHDYYKKIWEDAFDEAMEYAEIWLNRPPNLSTLTWKDVFEYDYTMNISKEDSNE